METRKFKFGKAPRGVPCAKQRRKKPRERDYMEREAVDRGPAGEAL